MEKKNKTNYFKIISYSVIFLFVIVYFVGSTGYYENQIAYKTTLTHDAIDKFENDILEGKVVDLESYVETDENNYETTFTTIGEEINESILLFVNEGLLEAGSIIKYLLS